MTQEKLSILNDLNEKQFREELLMLLLQKMGFTQVRLRHGTDEYGKDITFCEKSALSSTFYAVVAKVGNISGQSGKKRDEETVMTIEDQVKQAFDMPIEDVTQDAHPHRSVNKVLVWTTGKIYNNAQKRIVEKLDKGFRNVEFFDGAKTIDLLNEHMPSFFEIRDAVIATYFEAARTKHSRIEEMRALGGVELQKTLPAIFVHPTLTRFTKGIRNRRDRKIEPSEEVSYATFQRMSQNTVILGDMGTGKTALLRRLLIDIIDENVQASRAYPIPVMIQAKKLDLSASNAIEMAVATEYSGLAKVENGDLTEKMKEGKIIILLDGLDEIAPQTDVQQAIRLLLEFNKLYSGCRVVVSSRAISIFDDVALFQGYTLLQIQPFDQMQVKKMLIQWFGENSNRGDELSQMIMQPMTFAAILTTPLTLIIVVILYENGERVFPANLTELYNKYTELALGRWDSTRDIATQGQWLAKKFILRKLCWQMQHDRTLEVTSEGIIAQIKTTKTERGLLIDPHDVFNELLFRANLFSENESGNYEFKHRAFQEYFAGIELDSLPSSVAFAGDHFLDWWWSRCIFFACGSRSEADDYLQHIINLIKPSDNTRVLYAYQLGQITQAAYLARQTVKVQAVEQVIWNLVDGWDEFAYAVTSAMPGTAIKIGHLILLYLFFEISLDMSIASKTLAVALEELAQNFLKREKPVDQRYLPTRDQWFGYLLANTCRKIGRIDLYLNILESNIITDAELVMFGVITMMSLEKKGDIGGHQVRLKALLKRSKRKTSPNKEYLRDLYDSPPKKQLFGKN